MQRPSYEGVVDQMVHALAETRRARLERHAAYVALANAILADDDHFEQVNLTDHFKSKFVAA